MRARTNKDCLFGEYIDDDDDDDDEKEGTKNKNFPFCDDNEEEFSKCRFLGGSLGIMLG